MNTRSLLPLLVAPLLAACDPASDPSPQPESPVEPTVAPIVHTYSAPASGIFANAYLVETERGVVAVDATLTVSDARALRMQAEALDKPLLAVLLTHGHPDHYNGVTELLAGQDLPVYATAGVDEIIRRDDAAKAEQWTPVFGDEWPAQRTFPSERVEDGDSISLDGVRFTVHELGPGESHFDTYWVLEGEDPVAFIGDAAFHDMHAYMSDGHSGDWLANLDHLEQALADIPTLLPGHGPAGDRSLLGAQREYIELYRQTVQALAEGESMLSEEAKAELSAVIKEHLPTDALDFLIPLGADPVAAEMLAE